MKILRHPRQQRAFSNVDHIRPYTIYYVNRADFQTCADAHFEPGSVVYGYYNDPTMIHVVRSDGVWDIRWRWENFVPAQLSRKHQSIKPRRRDLKGINARPPVLGFGARFWRYGESSRIVQRWRHLKAYPYIEDEIPF